jgi:hypothetical protein
VAAPADVRLGHLDHEDRVRVDELASLPVPARPIARPDADLPPEQQGLGTGARFGKAPLDQQLIQPDPGRAHAAHRPMVTDAAAPGLTPGLAECPRTGGERRRRNLRRAVRLGRRRIRRTELDPLDQRAQTPSDHGRRHGHAQQQRERPEERAGEADGQPQREVRERRQ